MNWIRGTIPPPHWTVRLVLCAACTLLVARAAAQDEPSSEPKPAGPSIEQIEARVAEANQDAELTDEQRQPILDALEAAKRDVQAAADFRAEAAQYKQNTEAIPAAVEKKQNEIDNPPTPDPIEGLAVEELRARRVEVETRKNEATTKKAERDAETARRNQRTQEIQQELKSAQEELAKLATPVNETQSSNEAPSRASTAEALRRAALRGQVAGEASQANRGERILSPLGKVAFPAAVGGRRPSRATHGDGSEAARRIERQRAGGRRFASR